MLPIPGTNGVPLTARASPLNFWHRHLEIFLSHFMKKALRAERPLPVSTNKNKWHCKLWSKHHVSHGQFGSINWCKLRLARGVPPFHVLKKEQVAPRVMITKPCVKWSILFNQLMFPIPCTQSAPFQCQQTRTSGTESYDQNTMWPMVNLIQLLDVT